MSFEVALSRDEATSVPRPRISGGSTALAFTVFRGVIDRPEAPPGQIGISYGWWIGLVGGILILIGSVWRAQESAAARKPPGLA